MPPLALAMTTHTTRHLRRALLGACRQSRPPDALVVSCDTDAPDLAELVRACSGEFNARITLVLRPHQNACRISQVRNNAARALLGAGFDPSGHIVYMDGDCCPARDALARHERHGEHADLVVAFRIDLTPEQTERFREDEVLAGRPPAEISEDAHESLRARHRRYSRQLALKRWGLTKPHKPKVLSANFSISAAMLLQVNGFDEEYVGYGAEDDDLSRRAYAAGGRASIAVADAIVYHQWHPTRAPVAWEQASGVARFKMKLPARCACGIVNPTEQPDPVAVVFENGREEERSIVRAPSSEVSSGPPPRGRG